VVGVLGVVAVAAPAPERVEAGHGPTTVAGLRSTGIVTVTGRYDGSTLTSTGRVLPGVAPSTDRDFATYSDCPRPAIGWVPARKGSATAAEDLARTLPATSRAA
jgi:hypothetical protein